MPNVCVAIQNSRTNAGHGTLLKRGMNGMSSTPERWQTSSSLSRLYVSNVEKSSGLNPVVQSDSAQITARAHIEERLASITRQEFVNGAARNSQSINIPKPERAPEAVQTRSCTPPKATISTTELIAQCKLLKVCSVEQTSRSELVYDLTVDEAHDFFANGLLNRNCVDALRYSCERFISKAKGKVAEAKGEDAPRSRVIGTNSGDSPEQPVQRRSRRVASSSRGSML